jgi:MraZ protein
MEMITGEFYVTLDEKGRISLPATLRRILDEEKLTLTQCNYENCLWLISTKEYTDKLKQYIRNTNLLTKKDRDFRRRLFNSHSVEIDKAGRIPIVQGYRDFAGLVKDCIVLGQGDYIEIWDVERYRKYLVDSNDNFITASEELGSKLKNDEGDN